jgi:hypothetical protein
VKLLRLFAVICAALLAFSGCTSLKRSVPADRDLSTIREVFVVTNLNDNHRLAPQLVLALQSCGLRATHGPLTLLPATTDAVLHYDDRWSWDFGEHMTYLRLNLHDPGAVRPYASATRTKYVANSTDVGAALGELTDELFRPQKR